MAKKNEQTTEKVQKSEPKSGAISAKINSAVSHLEALRMKLGDALYSEVMPAVVELKDAARQVVNLENATLNAEGVEA